MPKRKRLGRLVKCPKCKTEINPYFIEFVPEVTRIAMGSAERIVVTPSRDVVKCPRIVCSQIFYTRHVEDADHIHG